MADSSMYLLAVGNKWAYKLKDGRTLFFQVIEEKGGVFFLADSFTLVDSQMKKSGDEYITNRYQQNTWQVKFQANGVDTTWYTWRKNRGCPRPRSSKPRKPVWTNPQTPELPRRLIYFSGRGWDRKNSQIARVASISVVV